MNKRSQNLDTALIVVDQQLDFQPGGALAVAGGDEIVEAIVELIPKFSTVVFTQDFHPKRHISFASSYEGKKPFDLLTLKEVQEGMVRSYFHPRETLLDYLAKVPNHSQVLWPYHCVAASIGA